MTFTPCLDRTPVRRFENSDVRREIPKIVTQNKIRKVNYPGLKEG